MPNLVFVDLSLTIYAQDNMKYKPLNSENNNVSNKSTNHMRISYLFHETNILEEPHDLSDPRLSDAVPSL